MPRASSRWVEFNNFWALILCLMIGTASLPHILMRYFTTPTSARRAQSVGWCIFFIFLLYFTAPAYAAFAKLEVYTERDRPDDRRRCRPGCTGHGRLVRLRCGQGGELLHDVQGVAATATASCSWRSSSSTSDVIVLAMPEIAGLPYVISGLVAGRRPGRGALAPPTACCSPSPTRSATTSTTR